LQARELDIKRAVSFMSCIGFIRLRVPRQIKYSVLICCTLYFVLSQGKTESYGNLMPFDIHIVNFDIERCGENRYAIPANAWK